MPHRKASPSSPETTRNLPGSLGIIKAILREFYTGTRQDRPGWIKLMNIIKKEDTIVFDSVSRMSRNATEGFKDYQRLYKMGVNLIFLKEPLINSSVFDSTRNNLINISIETGNTAVDDFFRGNLQLINNFMMALAEEQIKTAFDQADITVGHLQLLCDAMNISLNDFFSEDVDSDEIGAAFSKLSQIQKMRLIDFLKSL